MALAALVQQVSAKDATASQIVEALTAIRDTEEVNLETLKTSNVASVVGKLRRSKDAAVAKLAAELVDQWKALAQRPARKRCVFYDSGSARPLRRVPKGVTAPPPARAFVCAYAVQIRARVDYAEPGNAPELEDRAAAGSGAAVVPSSVAAYRALMLKQRKEMYKDPPVLPPTAVKVLDKRAPEMQRDEKTGLLKCADYKDFTPNLSPAEVLQAGSFGGTYYRSIDSAVTGVSYGADEWKEFPKEWFAGLNIKAQITAQAYNKGVNRYKVNCGGSLGMWESSGWIAQIDPYGWFQWYCRFYLGRRSSDDARQVSRWQKGHGAKGRFRAQLLNKCLAANTTFDDEKISPVIRQTCQHWGYRPTEADLVAQGRVKGTKAKTK